MAVLDDLLAQPLRPLDKQALTFLVQKHQGTLLRFQQDGRFIDDEIDQLVVFADGADLLVKSEDLLELSFFGQKLFLQPFCAVMSCSTPSKPMISPPVIVNAIARHGDHHAVAFFMPVLELEIARGAGFMQLPDEIFLFPRLTKQRVKKLTPMSSSLVP